MVPTEHMPSAQEMMALPTSELAVRLLHLIVEQGETRLLVRQQATGAELWPAQKADINPEDEYEFLLSIGEAWDWLFFRGLIARQAGSREDQQLYVTTQGEQVVQDPRGLDTLRAEARIDLPLHARIATRVRRQFLLGEYELAAFAAMREVEIRLGELSHLDELIGVGLAQQALSVGGPLADRTLNQAEQKGTMALFWGALAVFKNPSSHRQVEFDDPTLASEVIFLADLLMRILDRIERDVLPRKAKIAAYVAPATPPPELAGF